MNPNRTTASGERLTLITGMGRKPVTQKTVDAWCQRNTSARPARRRRS